MRKRSVTLDELNIITAALHELSERLIRGSGWPDAVTAAVNGHGGITVDAVCKLRRQCGRRLTPITSNTGIDGRYTSIPKPITLIQAATMLGAVEFFKQRWNDCAVLTGSQLYLVNIPNISQTIEAVLIMLRKHIDRLVNPPTISAEPMYGWTSSATGAYIYGSTTNATGWITT